MAKIFKNFMYNSTYQIIAIIIPLITSPYLARVLGPENLGIEGYVVSVSQIFYTIGMIGLTNYATREIAYVREDEYQRSKVFWEMIAARVIVFAATLAVYLIIINNTPYRIYFMIQIVWLFAMFFDASWFFAGMEIFGVTVARNLVVRLLTIISIFAFVKKESDLFLYIALCAVSQIVGTLSIFPQLRKHIVGVGIKDLKVKQHFLPSIKVFLPQVASVLYLQVDKVMIEALVDDVRQVAYYTKAEQLIKAPLALITAVSTVMMPRIANEFARDNEKRIADYLSGSLTFLMFMAWPVAFGMAGIAGTMIPWFLGDGYLPTAMAMMILAPIIIAIAASSLSANQYLLATNQTRIMTISYTASAILNLIVNACLIPKYGFVGAAIGTIAAEYTVFVSQYYVMDKQIQIIPAFLKCLKYALYSAIMFGIIMIIGNKMQPTVITTCIQIVVGASVYLLLLFMTKDTFFFYAIRKVMNRS
ncbi:oligosaccharide flippase family protein [Frisingicoccus sp.]|uniref:oligosaccharide flippase family protein n=1 Tax=Frisingicoccus sp. TaxID=1918627 RepID=UPI002E7A96A9|nr:oligosaccharide flippase family protein [Frisingicoccus sp.]MEE0751423.1 oligosaccharide flippase family protein [Frisingicoccus sp.]